MPGRKYIDLFECKPDDLCGVKNWWWIKGDTNSWEGPSMNWKQSHKDKYFQFVKKRDVVVTAGANHGIHARFYADTFKTVYAFEPNPIAFHCLVLNCPFDNVIKMNCALGSKIEMVEMKGHPDKTSGICKVQRGGYIPCLTIDTLNLSDCDLIQLDVEGYEGRILQGAIKTIEKFRPVVIAENGRKGDVMNLLQKMGYDYKEQSISDSIWCPK